MRQLAFVIGLTIFLGINIIQPVQSADAATQQIVLDFEDSTHDALYARTGDPAVALSTERASQGKRSLRLSFQRYEPGKQQWPTFTVDLEKAAAPRHWESYSELLADVYVESAAAAAVQIVLTSGPGKSWVGGVNVAPGKWTTLAFPLSEVGGDIDLRNVRTVGVLLTRPAQQTTVYLDAVRLRRIGLDEPRAVELQLLEPSCHAGFFHSQPEQRIAVRALPKAPADVLASGTFVFTLNAPDGRQLASRTVTGTALAKSITVTFPKPPMQDGETVSVRMTAMRARARLWQKSVAVTAYPAAPVEVTLRDDGVTLISSDGKAVRGEPFFPFGIYAAPPEEFGYLKQLGFNSVQTYATADAEYMSAAEKAGLRVLAPVKGSSSIPNIYHDPDRDPAPVKACVDALKRSPALLGYYLFDEPTPRVTSRDKLLAFCDLVRRLDPYHLVAGCNNESQLAYSRVADAMMVDAYPVPGPIDVLIRRMTDGHRAQSPNLALWFIPQAFNWETYFAHNLKPGAHGFGRVPTFDEVRTMPWIGIALGARGLFYYSFQTQGFYHRDAFPWFWRGFEYHIRETAALLPWLTASSPKQPASCDNPKVLLSVRQRGNDLLIVASNSALQPAEATITVPGLQGRTLHVVSENREVTPEGSVFHDHFDGMVTHIYITTLDSRLAALLTLDRIRAEVTQLHTEFLKDNPSLCTYRDGARLSASWEFPDPAKAPSAVWYRMIDGYPGTPWVVGDGGGREAVAGWSKKDFSSAGRWIEVRFRQPELIDRLRAIVTTGVPFELQVNRDGPWTTVKADTVVDHPSRHHLYQTATTTARFDPLTTDRWRIVFTQRKHGPEAVFELSAWEE